MPLDTQKKYFNPETQSFWTVTACDGDVKPDGRPISGNVTLKNVSTGEEQTVPIKAFKKQFQGGGLDMR